MLLLLPLLSTPLSPPLSPLTVRQCGQLGQAPGGGDDDVIEDNDVDGDDNLDDIDVSDNEV